MRVSTTDYLVEKNKDGTYKVIRKHVTCNGEQYVEIESLLAEDVITLPDGVLLAKYQGQYTMYAASLKDIEMGGCRYYGKLHKFLEGILEYFFFGDVFLYRTTEGWFFLFCDYAFWLIGNKDVRKKRVEGLTKLCESDTQILGCKVLNLVPYKVNGYDLSEGREYEEIRYRCHGYEVKTSEGKFLLYEGNGCIYDALPTYFIRMNRYSRVPGYERLIRIYPNTGKKFFLALLDHNLYCGEGSKHKIEMFQKITCLGEGYLLAQNGTKSKLLFCKEDGYFPETVVDWGIHSFTKLSSEKESGNELCTVICTKWLVNDGKLSHEVIHRYSDNWL